MRHHRTIQKRAEKLLLALLMLAAGRTFADPAIRNPHHTTPTWKMWYEDQTPVTGSLGTLTPVPENRRDYPVDPTTTETAAGLYWKVVPNDYPGRRYAGFFNDAYATGDGWHTNLPWSMTFDGGNTVIASQKAGDGGVPKNTRYINLEYDTFYSPLYPSYGINFSNQSTTLMGDFQVRYYAYEQEKDRTFRNTLHVGPSYSSSGYGQTCKDLYPALLPALFNADGASFDQMAGYGKMFYAGAYMPTDIKRELLRHGLYGVTVLYNWKASLPYQVPYEHLLRHRVSYAANGLEREQQNVPNAFEHLTGAFFSYDANLHFQNLVALNKRMTVPPPLALIRLVELRQGQMGPVNNASRLKTLVPLKHADGEAVEAIVSTDSSYDLWSFPIQMRAKVITGNKDTEVTRLGEHEWHIHVPWDGSLPPGRTDILFVANNGVFDSNPAVVSVWRDYGGGTGYSSVRRPVGLPQITRIVPGESLHFDLYTEDAQNLPISYYLHEGADGWMDGNRYVLETTPDTPAGLHKIAVTADNERTGSSGNGCAGKVVVQNTVAAIHADRLWGPAPLTVNFNAAASRDRDGGALTHTWDFDDGAHGAGEAVSHTFATPGIYRVSLKSTGALGDDIDRVMIQVEPNTWGLAQNRGWSREAGLDPAVWLLEGNAPTSASPTVDNSSGYIQLDITTLTTQQDYDLPCYIEADFTYNSSNNKLSFFDFFGHRIGFMNRHAVDVTQIGAPGELSAARSYLGFEANYDRPDAFSSHLGGASLAKHMSLRINLREDPAHPGKLLIVGDVLDTAGRFPVYFGNLTRHHAKLRLSSEKGSSAQFRIARYQVWTPGGALLQPDIQVLTADGLARVWDDYTDRGYPSIWPLPEGMDYGIVDAVNGALTRTFVIRNRGTATLSLTGSPLVSIPAQHAFDVTAQPAVTSLAPGETTTFDITLHATGTGSLLGTVSILSNSVQSGLFAVHLRGRNAMAPAINIEGNGLNIAPGDETPNETEHTDFGPVFVGQPQTRDYLIHNRGTLPLTILSATLSGSPDFSIVKQPRSPLGAFESSILRVQYAPAAVGPGTTWLTVQSDSVTSPVYAFALAGEGVAPQAPDVAIRRNGALIAPGATVNLGAVAPGEPLGRTFVFMIANAGPGPLRIGDVEITGADADFFILQQLPSPLAPAGLTVPFKITFAPDSERVFNATVTVRNDDADTPAYTFHLAGLGSNALESTHWIVY